MAAQRASTGHIGSLQPHNLNPHSYHNRVLTTPESSHSGRGVKDNLSSVQTIGTPVEGVVSPIAYVDRYTTWQQGERGEREGERGRE